MLIYFVVLAIAVAAVHQACKEGTGRVGRRLLYASAFALLVLIGGLRSSSVGTDVSGYVRHFEATAELADVRSSGLEPGIPLLSWLAHYVSSDYAAFFTLVAIVVAAGFFLGIRKLSVNPAMSVFVMLASGAYYFSFNGLRQGIAAAVLFLAIGFIYYRKLWAFLVCVAVASMFHISAVMFLPTYFIVPRQNNFRYNILILVGVVLATLFFSEMVTLAGRLNQRYLEYGVSVGRRAGLVYQASVVAMGVFFLYFKRHVQEHRALYDLLLNLYLLGVLVTLVAFARATFVSGVLRMNIYFTSSQILLWPIVFVNLRGHRHRGLAALAFVGFYVVYHATYLSRFSNLVPYELNPLVQSWLPTWFSPPF
jgi:hypothetical protein